MRRSVPLLAILILAATAVLCALGYWQVKRLAEKEALIAYVTQRVKSPPVPLAEIEADNAAGADIEYRPMTLAGVFDHSREVYYLATLEVPGWHVYAPLTLDDGRLVMVNRGFVPQERRDPATRPGSQPQGRVEIEGIARVSPREKPNSLIPDNDIARREFFWKNLSQMAQAAGVEQERLLPFFVDAGPGPDKTLPVGGVTRIDFPNNHLQYAITWFGLAAACAGVGGWFLWSMRSDARNARKEA
jgi:surfeit locus 1 family protein